MAIPAAPPVYDKVGRLVELGDRVAVAVSSGHSASLKIGRVTKITEKKLTLVLEGPIPKYGNNTTSIEHGIRKFLNVNELTNP